MTIYIADKEITRKKKLDIALEYLSQQFANLELKLLANELEQCEFVVNRVLDVRSFCINEIFSLHYLPRDPRLKY